MTKPDRIELLARRHIASHGVLAVQAAEAAIAYAEARSDWDEAGTWHRVRLRIIRIAPYDIAPPASAR